MKISFVVELDYKSVNRLTICNRFYLEKDFVTTVQNFIIICNTTCENLIVFLTSCNHVFQEYREGVIKKKKISVEGNHTM